MNAEVPYSVEVRRNAESGRNNGAVLGALAYGAGLVAAVSVGVPVFGASLAINGVVLFGGLFVAGLAGSYAGKAIAGAWTSVAKSPTLTSYETPLVASEDVSMTHKVQLSSKPEHVAYVHEGKVVETKKGEIKDINSYQDYITETRSASHDLDENLR